MENLKIEKHEWAAGQGFYGEQSTFPKDLGAISRHCLFQSDANMRSFSSMENVGGAKGSALLSQDLTTLSECDGQINEHSVSKSSKRKVHGGSKPLHDESQVVSSCFEQPAACTNGEITPDDDGVGASQACTKSSFRLDCKQIYNLREQRDDEIPIGDLQQSTSSSSITTINYSSSPFQDVIGKDMTQMPNKRRRAISDLSPWYKEVTGAARQHNSMSNTELDWARTTNRLTEKIVAECLMRSGQSTARSWRRLIWTTQLMQQLFPPLPCISLTANASSTYENIAYTTAKLALTDACSHMCSTEVNRVQHLTGGDMISKEINTSEKDRDCSFSNILENCLQRFRKLETGFLRWEKGYSTLDLRMECHDLEKYTTIIRFARFHVLAETDGLENSIQSANCEVFLQRHVTALRTPEKLPKGLSYLSL